MKKYFIEVQRELDRPAQFHIEAEKEPTNEEIKKMFEDAGYSDNWDYIGRVIIKEVFTN